MLYVKATPEELKAINRDAQADNIGLALLQGPSDPALKDYNINPDPKVKNTVIVYKNRKTSSVLVNFRPGKDDEKLKQAIEEVCK